MNTQHVTYQFSYFFMESSFLMSDLSNLDFLTKFRLQKFFRGVFKIFLKIFQNYKVIWKTHSTKIIGLGATPSNPQYYKKNSKIVLILQTKTIWRFFKVFWDIFKNYIFFPKMFCNSWDGVHPLLNPNIGVGRSTAPSNPIKKKFLIHEFTLFLMLRLVCGIQVVTLYGAMPQFRRIETYKSFVSKQAQCLFHNHLLQNLHGHEKKICRIK